MASVRVAFRHHVKEKRFHVEIKSLVIEKEFGQQAQILTVHFVLFAVHFKDGDVVLPVNLVAGGMTPHALGQVTPQDCGAEGIRGLTIKQKKPLFLLNQFGIL